MHHVELHLLSRNVPQSHHVRRAEASKQASRHSSIGPCSLLPAGSSRMHARHVRSKSFPPAPPAYRVCRRSAVGCLNQPPVHHAQPPKGCTSTTFERSIPCRVIVPRRPRTIRSRDLSPPPLRESVTRRVDDQDRDYP